MNVMRQLYPCGLMKSQGLSDTVVYYDMGGE